MGRGYGLNARAMRIFDELWQQADELGFAAETLPSGTRVLDAGVEVPGGFETGLGLARLTLAGLGRLELLPWEAGGLHLPGIAVALDRPYVACLLSQYAGWAVRPEGYFAMGSGPARALIRAEELYEELDYVEEAPVAVLVLESRQLPTDAVARHVAERAGVVPANLALAVAPTASIAGSVQVAARVVETGLHKLHALGFDVRRVQSGFGTSPLAPVAASDFEALGRTNDCLLYGGWVQLTVEADDAEIETLLDRLPSSSSPDYGEPFARIFERYGRDFYRIDPLLFSPAAFSLTSTRTGRSFTAGAVNPGVLRLSLQGEEA